MRSLSLHELIHQLKSALTSVDLSACHDSQLLWFISISWYSTYHDLSDCHNLSLIMIISYYDLSAYHNFSTYHDLSPVLKCLIMWCLHTGGGEWCVGSRLHSQPFPPSISLHCTLSIHHYSTVLKLQVFFRLKYNCCVEKKKPYILFKLSFILWCINCHLSDLQRCTSYNPVTIYQAFIPVTMYKVFILHFVFIPFCQHRG